jgi:uncharacterized coiled-coil protein SlyX
MDWFRIVEIVCTVSITLAGWYGANVMFKTATKNKLEHLEEKVAEHSKEFKELNSTLTSTNQNLAALNATVKGLANWLERVDERQHAGK